MPQLSRLHTVAVVALIALIPLVPLGLWLYARAASVDRGDAVAANERVFRSVPPPPGTRVLGRSISSRPRWDYEGALVPVDGYVSAYTLQLPRAEPPTAIVAHYRRVLRGWQLDLGSAVTFTRGNAKFQVDETETMQSPSRTRTFLVYVSQ